MFKKLNLLFAIVLFASACQNQSASSEAENGENSEATSTQVKELKHDVMAVHDRVMPKMNKMSQLQTQLKKTAAGKPDSARFMSIASELNQAQEGMMNWMRNFKYPEDEGWSKEETVEYLRGQKDEMLQIEQQTNLSIQRADSILEASNKASL